jgi:hypothetical protein
MPASSLPASAASPQSVQPPPAPPSSQPVPQHVAAAATPPATAAVGAVRAKAAATAPESSIPAPQPRNAEEQRRLDELRGMSKTDRNARYNMFKRAMTTSNHAKKHLPLFWKLGKRLVHIPDRVSVSPFSGRCKAWGSHPPQRNLQLHVCVLPTYWV